MNHYRLMAVVISLVLLLFLQFVHVTSTVNPYQVLNVGRDASQSQIRRAFKKLALQW